MHERSFVIEQQRGFEAIAHEINITLHRAMRVFELPGQVDGVGERAATDRKINRGESGQRGPGGELHGPGNLHWGWRSSYPGRCDIYCQG